MWITPRLAAVSVTEQRAFHFDKAPCLSPELIAAITAFLAVLTRVLESRFSVARFADCRARFCTDFVFAIGLLLVFEGGANVVSRPALSRIRRFESTKGRQPDPFRILMVDVLQA